MPRDSLDKLTEMFKNEFGTSVEDKEIKVFP
jgi:hypothetical protein